MAGKKVIITGVPGVGKTSVINESMSGLRLKGFPIRTSILEPLCLRSPSVKGW